MSDSDSPPAGPDRVGVAGAAQPVGGVHGDEHRLLLDEGLHRIDADGRRLQVDHLDVDSFDSGHVMCSWTGPIEGLT